MRLLVQIVDQKNQIPLWKSFTGMHIWILLTLVAVTLNELLLQNISKEQRSIVLPEDFNVNFLNYDKDNQTNELFDSYGSASCITLILQSTKITSPSNFQCY